MPAHASNPLREARVGLVTLCLVLGVTATSVVLATLHWQPRENYRLAFRVNQDATGIEVGTPVRMGGIQWGEVTRVSRGDIPAEGSLSGLAQPGALSKSRGTLVEFSLDSRLELWPDAKVTRVASILGGDVHLVVLDTGLTRGAMASLALKTRESLGQREVLQAWESNTTVPSLLGTRLASRLEQLPNDWDELVRFYREKVQGTLPAKRDTLVQGFQSIRDAVRADLKAWERPADALGTGFANLRQQVRGPDGTVTMVEKGWKDMQPSLDAVEQDFARLRERIETQTQPRLVAVGERAQAEWDRSLRVWSALSSSGVEAFDAYGSVMADSSLMGGQLTHAADDGLGLLVRLLLGKPGESGLARMHRFEAATRLAVAVSDLRCANDALQSIADGTERVDPAMASRLREAASRAVARFRASVDQLNQLWQQPVQ